MNIKHIWAQEVSIWNFWNHFANFIFQVRDYNFNFTSIE